MLCSGGAAIEFHVTRQRRLRRTDRAAIDTGGLDRDEDDAVHRRVAAAEGVVSCVEVWHGAAIVAEAVPRESDPMTGSENDRA